MFSMLYVVSGIVIGYSTVTFDAPFSFIDSSDRCLIISTSFSCLSRPLGSALTVTRILYMLRRLLLSVACLCNELISF